MWLTQNQKSICDVIAEKIRKYGYIIHRKIEDGKHCVIDFRHPKIKPEFPMAYFVSSLRYDKERKCLRTTVRSKVDKYKELYLDYCCENGEMVCRPHVWMEERILSVDAYFCEKPLEKLERLLAEML